VKLDTVFFRAFCAAALLLTADLGGVARSQDAEQKKKEEKKIEQISAEDREVIEHMEMLKNLELFDNADVELLKNLDVLTANE
jgi:hypothetical protein